MIIKMQPLALSEVKEIVDKLEEKKELKEYLKNYAAEDIERTKKIIGEIKELKNLKLKEEHIIKIADFMPKTAEDLNKIFGDFSLDEKETNEIIAIVRGK